MLSVNIYGAGQNSPPGADPKINYLVSVDEFILTNIFPSNLGAIDLESNPEDLYFRITENPQIGFITHTRSLLINYRLSYLFLFRDHTRPIESFTMQDLIDLKIAYQLGCLILLKLLIGCVTQ